jgi:hypothetical protein
MAKFKTMEMKCARLKFLAHNGVDGCPQFRKFRNATILNYCVEILKGNDAPFIDNDRIAQEITEMELESKLNDLKRIVRIESDTQWEDETAFLGVIEGKRALFTINTSKNFSPRPHAMTVMYIKDKFMIPDNVMLATVVVNDSKIREYAPHGLLTKNGAPDKRDGIGTWNNLREKVQNTIQEYENFIANSHDLPEPTFGECNVCPYHNYKITWNGVDYVCNG